MHGLVTALPARHVLARELPAAAVSLLIAELFYKFHSFTLECIAFLATWWVIGALAAIVTPKDAGE